MAKYIEKPLENINDATLMINNSCYRATIGKPLIIEQKNKSKLYDKHCNKGHKEEHLDIAIILMIRNDYLLSFFDGSSTILNINEEFNTNYDNYKKIVNLGNNIIMLDDNKIVLAEKSGFELRDHKIFVINCGSNEIMIYSYENLTSVDKGSIFNIGPQINFIDSPFIEFYL